jgi:hypothetical protein
VSNLSIELFFIIGTLMRLVLSLSKQAVKFENGFSYQVKSLHLGGIFLCSVFRESLQLLESSVYWAVWAVRPHYKYTLLGVFFYLISICFLLSTLEGSDFGKINFSRSSLYAASIFLSSTLSGI